MPVEQTTPKIIVGWREWLALPELGITSLKVKVDTGARTSALHIDSYEIFERAGERWVRFEINLESRRHPHPISAEAKIIDERPVTDSGGTKTSRLFIQTLVTVGEQSWPIELNLTNRRDMMFPMLLGRTAMADRILVDPASSYALGRRRHKKLPQKSF